MGTERYLAWRPAFSSHLRARVRERSIELCPRDLAAVRLPHEARVLAWVLARDRRRPCSRRGNAVEVIVRAQLAIGVVCSAVDAVCAPAAHVRSSDVSHWGGHACVGFFPPEEVWAWLSRQLRRQLQASRLRDAAVDDVIQETLLRAMRVFGVEPAQPPPVLWSWCVTTSRNLFVDAVRQHRREQVALHRRGLRIGDAAAGESMHVAVVAEMRSQVRTTQSAVMELLTQGESTRTIAERLGITTRGVELCRQRLRRLAIRIGASLGAAAFLNRVVGSRDDEGAR
jgi:DNA-directed RNA polymerase specialized sigma24 family protein